MKRMVVIVALLAGCHSDKPSMTQDPKSIYRNASELMGEGEYARAAVRWEEYVKLDPKSAPAFDSLAQAYEMSGQLDKAEAAYKRGMEIDSEDHSSQVNYGLMLARHGRMEEARKELAGVMKDSEAHYNMGVALEQVGKTQEARREYEAALKADPEMKEAKTKLGM